MKTNEEIGLRLRALREESGDSQRQVAVDLRLTPQTVCNYEKGIRTIPFPLLVRFARHFKVSVEHFAEAVDGRVPAWAVERKEPCEYCKPKYYEFYKVIHMEKYCPNCGRRLEKVWSDERD